MSANLEKAILGALAGTVSITMMMCFVEPLRRCGGSLSGEAGLRIAQRTEVELEADATKNNLVHWEGFGCIRVDIQEGQN
jgi:hypothetical protein